jgi:hypothetical protein
MNETGNLNRLRELAVEANPSTRQQNNYGVRKNILELFEKYKLFDLKYAALFNL